MCDGTSVIAQLKPGVRSGHRFHRLYFGWPTSFPTRGIITLTIPAPVMVLQYMLDGLLRVGWRGIEGGE